MENIRKTFIFAGMIVCFAGALYAQSEMQPVRDPGPLKDAAPAKTVDDNKLVSTPAVPADLAKQFEQNLKDVHFDFDRAELRAEDRQILASDAEWLKAHPDVLITLEGDADSRGDIVYNVVLSGERAWATRSALIEMGLPEDRIAFATGWGKLYPTCSEEAESCWSQNRRTHIAAWPPAVEEGTQVASAKLSD